MKTLLPLLVILVLTGCKPALKTVYGIKEPQLENDQSINQYLSEHKLDKIGTLKFPTVFSFAMASQMDYLVVPDAIFYNREGFLVPYKKEAVTCNANVPEFIAELKNFGSKPADQARTLKQFQNLLGLNPEEHVADVTVFITWTKYSGRLNKTKAFEWIKLLDKAKDEGISVSYHLLNCDFQQSWNLSEEQLKQFGLKK